MLFLTFFENFRVWKTRNFWFLQWKSTPPQTGPLLPGPPKPKILYKLLLWTLLYGRQYKQRIISGFFSRGKNVGASGGADRGKPCRGFGDLAPGPGCYTKFQAFYRKDEWKIANLKQFFKELIFCANFVKFRQNYANNLQIHCCGGWQIWFSP